MKLNEEWSGHKKMNMLECECNFCGGSVRFEASKTGELVNCLLCNMETILSAPGSAKPYPPEQYFLQATNIGWSRNANGVRAVVGSVINNSDKNFDWVRIEFTLVRRDGKPVGGASDCLIHFPPRGVWTFHAPVFQAEAAGVGAPMISCEYGKIFVAQRAPEKEPLKTPVPMPPSMPVPPKSAPPKSAPTSSSQAGAPKQRPANEWTGIRITGGVTGTAHRQQNG